MPRKTKAKFTMKGHTLPGIKQDPAMANKTSDYRPGSSAFTMKKESPAKIMGAIKKFAGSKIGRAGLALTTGGMSEVARGIFGGGKKKEDADAGKELLKQEAKEEMANSPAAMKLRTGRKKRLGGKLNSRTTPFDQKQDFEPAFEGADMSRQEYERKLKVFMRNGFSKKDATEFIGDGVSVTEAKKKRREEFNFGKLRKKPTMLDTDFSGRFQNPG